MLSKLLKGGKQQLIPSPRKRIKAAFVTVRKRYVFKFINLERVVLTLPFAFSSDGQLSKAAEVISCVSDVFFFNNNFY